MAVKRKLREEHEKRKQAAAAAASAAAAKAAATDAADASDPAVDPAAQAAAAEQERSKAEEAAAAVDEESPFACISVTMGYDTFHLVQMLWLGVIDMPTNSSEKDWELQVCDPRGLRTCQSVAPQSRMGGLPRRLMKSSFSDNGGSIREEHVTVMHTHSAGLLRQIIAIALDLRTCTTELVHSAADWQRISTN